LNVELPSIYQNSISNIDSENNNPLVKILISGNKTQNSVIINLYEKFNVKAKIISAQLEYVGYLILVFNSGITGEKISTKLWLIWKMNIQTQKF
jgi:ABC-type methionine transport system ATPase subunit